MCIYLSQGEFHASQVVIVAQVTGCIVNVINAQFEVLHHLKVVVQTEALTEGRAGGVLDTLGAAQLSGKKRMQESINHRQRRQRMHIYGQWAVTYRALRYLKALYTVR